MRCELTIGYCLLSWLLVAGLKSSVTLAVTEGTFGFSLGAPNWADAVKHESAINEKIVFLISSDSCVDNNVVSALTLLVAKSQTALPFCYIRLTIPAALTLCTALYTQK